MKFRIFFTTKNLNKLNDPRTPLLPTYSKIWQKKWQKWTFLVFYRIRREKIFKNGSFIFFSIFKKCRFYQKNSKTFIFSLMNSRTLSNITTCAPYLSLAPTFFFMPGIYRNKIKRFCSYTNNYNLFQPILHHTIVKM